MLLKVAILFVLLYVIVVGVFVCLVVYWLFYIGPSATWRVAEYMTDNVHIDPKPSDCDFLHAPLGEKDCHYEPIVAAYNVSRELVGGDYAPKYRYDTIGRPIISWDKGKTWFWCDCAKISEPKRHVRSGLMD